MADCLLELPLIEFHARHTGVLVDERVRERRNNKLEIVNAGQITCICLFQVFLPGSLQTGKEEVLMWATELDQLECISQCIFYCWISRSHGVF